MEGWGDRRNWEREEVGEESGRDTELERCRELERLILVKEAENLKMLVEVRGMSKREYGNMGDSLLHRVNVRIEVGPGPWGKWE